jgi:GNAT superfamily N-acetyltransferase
MRILTTYLEACEPPPGPAAASPSPGLAVSRARLTRPDYLSLWRRIGLPVQWDARLHQSDAEIDALLASDEFILFVLRREGSAIGLCEFETREAGIVELTHFGLVPEAQGNGFGRYFLDFALRAIWAEGARRVWLHTDTEDSPRAMPLYRGMGFRQFDQRWLDYPD